MKLLFLTQVLDEGDAVLGFVPRWIQGLARNCERVRVIALEKGETSSLPPNVDVRVVGRSGTISRWFRSRFSPLKRGRYFRKSPDEAGLEPLNKPRDRTP